MGRDARRYDLDMDGRIRALGDEELIDEFCKGCEDPKAELERLNARREDRRKDASATTSGDPALPSSSLAPPAAPGDVPGETPGPPP
jgi:hypothetical protein